MTFRKVDMIFVVLALLVVAGVALLPSPRDRNPKVPANSAHQAITDLAGAMGFSSASHFTRHYKLMFDELPSQTSRMNCDGPL